MAAALLSFHRCCRLPTLPVAKRLWSSGAVARPPLHTRVLLYFTQRFYDIELLLTWTSKFRKRGVLRKNTHYGYTERLYGPHVAAAYFILKLKGGLRYCGHTDWFRADHRGKFNWDFINYKDCPLEEIDLSYTVINYDGLENFEGQQAVQTLSLRGCPEVDDWFLSRLHTFQDSLKELDISHCPNITIGGLAALRNLKGLQRLNVSSISGVSNPGLVVILLEEMLPKCHITAEGYEFHLAATEDDGQMQR